MDSTEHASLSWTGCYFDSCLIHLSDKQGSNWFPKPPKKPKRAKDRYREIQEQFDQHQCDASKEDAEPGEGEPLDQNLGQEEEGCSAQAEGGPEEDEKARGVERPMERHGEWGEESQPSPETSQEKREGITRTAPVLATCCKEGNRLCCPNYLFDQHDDQGVICPPRLSRGDATLTEADYN